MARRAKSRTGTWRWTGTTGRKRARRTAKLPATVKKPPPRENRAPAKRPHRPPNAVEQRARVNFDALERALDSGIAGLLDDWKAIKADQIAELAEQIRAAAGSPVALAGITATARGADILLDALRAVTEAAGREAIREANAQGVTIPPPDTTELEQQLEARANAAATLLARSLSEAAARRSVHLAGPAIAPDDVAQAVTGHLEGLSDSYLRDQFNGLLTGGMNAGRTTVMGATDAPARYYSSALLDSATCRRCEQADGKEYDSLLEVLADFPTSGRADCLGGTRCRCSPIAIFEEAKPSKQ
ncbi:MAG TPA: hypothetical protein VN213_13585 [Solirubrobacteraceae bacterium]|nr:hypothetical protein [Solirubrobacteraceae bacterium]